MKQSSIRCKISAILTQEILGNRSAITIQLSLRLEVRSPLNLTNIKSRGVFTN